MLPFEDWDLEFLWCLEFGVWNLEFGIWNLEFGVWCLVFGISCVICFAIKRGIASTRISHRKSLVAAARPV
jgi:hypothetical protein